MASRHPLLEVIGQEAAVRRAQGQRGFLLTTALDFGVSRSLVRKALHTLGIVEPTRQGTPPRAPVQRMGYKTRLSMEEQREITWCPECGNIHIYLPCEWCSNWAVVKQAKAGRDKARKRAAKKVRSRIQAYRNRNMLEWRRRYFFNNDPPTKDG